MNTTSTSPEGLEPTLVSVIIPCYNHAHFLGEALDSVMLQTWPDFEIIVVDDGSTDNTRHVVSRYPWVQYIYQSNQGLAAARNTGLGHSKGNFLLFLDADDRLRSRALETGVGLLQTHRDCVFVVGQCQHIAEDGSCLPSYSTFYRNCADHYGALLKTNFILNPGSVIYRRTVFESVGAFDVFLRAAEDYDLYLRIVRQHSIYCHGEVVVEYRRHSANMSSKPALMFETILTVLRSQRSYVTANPQYEEAYRTRLHKFRGDIGGNLIEDVIAQIRTTPFSKRLFRDLLLLLREYPAAVRIIGSRVYRKIRRELYRRIFQRFARA